MAEIELPDPDELEERRDKTFSRRVALLTAIYAIVLAFASLGGASWRPSPRSSPKRRSGEVFLQIAIVSSSVSILAASRPMMFFSLGLALLGAGSTVNGYVLLYRLGFLH